MRLCAFVFVATLFACSPKNTALPEKQQGAEQVISLDTFLDNMAKQSEKSEATALATAQQEISELGKVDQMHEQKLLTKAQQVSLANMKSAFEEMTEMKGFDLASSPSGRYFARRAFAHSVKTPDFKSLVRWGWENVLGKKDRKFEVVADWMANYSAHLTHQTALPELVKSLSSGKKPSDEALKLYADVFATDRLPHGW